MQAEMLTIDLAQEINDELARARTKFPCRANLTVALMEEVGELAQAQLQSLPCDKLRQEAIQVIVMALRILTEGDASIPRVQEAAHAR